MDEKISGKVERGRGYGKKLGFPTMNIRNNSKVKHGVYAGTAILGKKKYRAGIVIGKHAEAHLIGYNGNSYGKTTTFEIGKFIRKFKKFKTEKELVTQIKKDLKKC
jgi:FAD synthase